MGNLIFWWRVSQVRSPKLASPLKSNTGFTLVEILIVVLIFGILSGAFAAPAWFAFTQRQRLNKANDSILGALQQAQREALRTKLSYSVSFISNQAQVPQFVVYPTNQNTTYQPGCYVPASSDPRWTNLGQNALQPKQVLLYTNIASITCTTTTTTPPTPNQLDSSGTSLATTAKTVTFDATGALPLGSSTGLKVVVAQVKPGTSPPYSSTLDSNAVKRCVIVQNLIGGTQTLQDSSCN